MASGTFYSAVGADDGKISGTSFDNTSTGLYFGATNKHIFCRFSNVVIPTGATINSAYVKFTAYLTRTGTTVRTNIYFNDIDNAIAPTNTSEFNSLALTSGIAWDNIPAWAGASNYNTPDLTSILQNVIDLGGWASGQSIMVIIKDDGSDSGIDRTSRAIEWGGSGVGKAELHVTWSSTTEVLCPESFLSESSLSAIIEPSWDEIICPVSFSAQASLQSIPTIEIISAQFVSAGALQAQPEFQIFTGGALTSVGSISTIIEKPFSVATLPRVYIFTLTGGADGVDDIIIPISSFQSRTKSGDPSYLSVVIPTTEYSNEINERLNGKLVVHMGYSDGSKFLLLEIVSEVNFENIRIDEGAVNQSITLEGHKTESWIGKAVNLEGASYMNLANGKLRYRCKPDLYLRPGDTANINDDSFVVESIAYSVSAELETYEIAN